MDKLWRHGVFGTMNLKLFYPLLGLALGILIADFIPGNFWIAPGIISVALIGWLVISILSKDPARAFSLKNYHYVWIFTLFLGLGILNYNIQGKAYPDNLSEKQPYIVIGKINEVKYRSDGDRFKISVSKINDTTGKVIKCKNLNIILISDGYNACIGETLQFKGILEKYLSKNNINTKMRHQGIGYFAKVKSTDIKKINSNLSLLSQLNEIKQKIIILLEKSRLDRTTSEFLISIILGEKSLLDENLRQTITGAGLGHIMALSGMHVAIIFSIFLALLFPLSLGGFHKTRRFVALAFLWCYVIFTGAAPSTMRAAIMATFIVFAITTQRKNSALNALFASSFFILLFSPLSIWNIGFQLSFICVASIILFVNKLNPIEHHVHPKLHYVFNLAIVTIVSSLATWALVAYYFGNVPLLFLPANLLLLPFIPVFISIGIIYIVLLALGWDSIMISKGLDIIMEGFIGISNFVSFNGKASYDISIPYYSVLIWLAVLILFVWFLYTDKKINKKIGFSCAMGMLGCFILISFLYNPQIDSSFKIVNSIAKLETHLTSNGKTSKFQFPRSNISYLNANGLRIFSIDAKIAPSHWDKIKSLDNQNIDCLIIGSQADFSQMAELINNTNIPRIVMHSGIGKNQKNDLLKDLNPENLDKVYWLRENGSLEFELPFSGSSGSASTNELNMLL